MTTELVLITAFVLVTFLFLQIAKARRPRQAKNPEMNKENEAELLEVSEFQENATLK